MWEISVSGQAVSCLYSLALGAILCVFYDFFRALRKVGINSYLSVFIGDMLFWLCSTVVVFLFLVSVTNGEMRGYILFFCLVGFIIYRFTVGRLLFNVTAFFLSFILKFYKRTVDIIAVACTNIMRGLRKAFGGISRIFFRIFKNIKKVLKNMYSMLYTKKDKSKLEYDVNE